MQVKPEYVDRLIDTTLNELTLQQQLNLIVECQRKIAQNSHRGLTAEVISENKIWNQIISDLKSRNGLS